MILDYLCEGQQGEGLRRGPPGTVRLIPLQELHLTPGTGILP